MVAVVPQALILERSHFSRESRCLSLPKTDPPGDCP